MASEFLQVTTDIECLRTIDRYRFLQLHDFYIEAVMEEMK
jgi:hypothetical protein